MFSLLTYRNLDTAFACYSRLNEWAGSMLVDGDATIELIVNENGTYSVCLTLRKTACH